MHALQTLLPWITRHADELLLALCLLVLADGILSIFYHRRLHNVLVRPHIEHPFTNP